MGQTRSLLCWMTLLLVMGSASRPAGAQIQLKPGGHNAAPLRVKALNADVDIHGQFATTQMAVTFQNELPYQSEADFLYRLPSGAVVTDFAYYYGAERVTARIVEKKQAQAIYRRIIYVHRDPALVEMVGKNLFRARISPVMPNSDLRVEMTLVQALPSTAQGAVYRFPLREDVVDDMLDSLRISAFIKADSNLVRVISNYGLPLEKTGGGWRLTLAGTNERPRKGLEIGLIRRAAPLRAEMYAAPSGGRDGFFALALTPAHTLTHPVVRIIGVPVTELTPNLPASVQTGQALMVYGRYRGGGRATVTLSGLSSSGPVTLTQALTFGTQREPRNIASKLWAAHWIEQVTRQGASRKAVIALSLQYTLPSQYTSWLAIPHAERLRLVQEDANPGLRLLAQQLAGEILAGRAETPGAKALRAKLTALCRPVEEKPDDFLEQEYYQPLTQTAEGLAQEIARGNGDGEKARQLREQLNTLCQRTGHDPQKELEEHQAEAYGYEEREVSRQLAQEIAQSGEDSPATATVRAKYDAWVKKIGDDSRWSFLDYALNDKARNTRDDLVKEINEGRESGTKAQDLFAQMSRLKQAATETKSSDTENTLADSEREYAAARADGAARQLARLLAQGQGETDSVKQARAQLAALCQKAVAASKYAWPDETPEGVLQQQLPQALTPQTDQVAAEINAGRPDSPAAKQARAQIDAALSAAGPETPYERNYLKNQITQQIAQKIYPTATPLAEALAKEILAGRPDSAQANALRTHLRALCDPAQIALPYLLNRPLNRPIYDVAARLSPLIVAGHGDSPNARKLRARLALLCRDTTETPQSVLRDELRGEIEGLADDLTDKIAKGDTGPAAQTLRARLLHFCAEAGVRPKDALSGQFRAKMGQLAEELVTAKHGGAAWRPHGYDVTSETLGPPNPTRVAFLRGQMERLSHLGGGPVEKTIDEAEYPWNMIDSETTRDELITEESKDAPDPQKSAALEARFTLLNTKLKGRDYALARTERIKIGIAGGKLGQRMASVSPQSPLYKELTTPPNILAQREKELHVRMGDPLILADAPADARQVVALMPGGEVKRLMYNPANRRWEARFDVPADAAEGDYPVIVIAVLPDNSRQTQTLHYGVRLTPPTGAARAAWVTGDDGPCLRLEVDASDDTARVGAQTPWGEEVTLAPSTLQPHRFFLLATVPANWQPPIQATVAFTLTDRAHNQAVVTAEAAP